MESIMRYLSGVVSNLKIHTKTSVTSNRERVETNTQYIHTFDINNMGMSYHSGQPAKISDGDSLAIAYNGLFGKKIKAIWNRSNMTYSGHSAWPFYIVALVIIALFVSVIFFGIPWTVEFFTTPIKFYNQLIPLLMIVPLVGSIFLVLSIMLGIATSKMTRKLKAL